MKKLEEQLNSIQELKGNLGAIIVVKQEIGHWEDLPATHYSEIGGRPSIDLHHSHYVVDIPGETIPDKERREAARAKLEELYASSPYIIARFSAGRALGYSLLDMLKEQTAKKY